MVLLLIIFMIYFYSKINARTNYALRNSNQLDLMACRTELFAKSFFPSAVSLWNDLPEHIKSVDFLSLFKSLVLRTFPSYKVPRHFL